MHPGRCAAFRELAQARSKAALEILAARFDLAVTTLPAGVRPRWPEVAAMELDQAIAAMLEELVAKTGGDPAAPPLPDGEEAIFTLDLPDSTLAALRTAGYQTCRQLAAADAAALQAIPGIGPASVKAIDTALTQAGY